MVPAATGGTMSTRHPSDSAALSTGDEALRQEAERCRRLVENVDAIVWEMDAEQWRFTFVSRAAERILGYPLSSWLEQPHFWPSIIHPEDREAAVALCAKA